jgi:tetratricopeptide (TPR) repeat protein
MVEWYRNKTWSDATEAQFEAKLARARDKSQYLKIQGYELLSSDPKTAARLLDRSAEFDDHWRADALLYLGQARLRLGDADGAVEALDAAVEQEQRVPWARTGARSDRALIISFYSMTERYDDILPYLANANVDLKAALAEELAAEAMILTEVGDRKRAAHLASEALRWLDGLTDGKADQRESGIGPGTGISPAALLNRLERIASSREL